MHCKSPFDLHLPYYPTLPSMAQSPCPQCGLRIDYTDKDDPILSGAIGVRTHGAPAWFDNIVVLPIKELP